MATNEHSKPAPNVVQLATHRTCDTTEALEKLLAYAKDGRIAGLLCCVQWDTGVLHSIATGEFKRMPTLAVGAAHRAAFEILSEGGAE